MVTEYFFDSYALYEIAVGNPNYGKYASKEAYTSIMNIAEFYYHLLFDVSEDIADEKTIPLFSMALPIKPLTLKRAMLFRFVNKKKKLSYVDCIGYFLAKENNLKFLTGDQQFKGMPNVEFVK